MKAFSLLFFLIVVFGCIQASLPQNSPENSEQNAGQNFSQNTGPEEETVLNAGIQEPLKTEISVSSEEELFGRIDDLVEQQIAGQEN